MTINDIMTRDEAAKYLRVTRSYLDTAGAKGPPFFRVGRLIRYRKIDIEQWLSDNTAVSAAASNRN